MGEWGFLGGLFDSLQAHSPMLGRFWLLIMLVFRILILGTVASDLFDDEQEEFACNTLQPGCKQVCYDMAFPISQYRFWVFHIVLIATPSLVFLMYAMHHDNKRNNRSKVHQSDSSDSRADLHFRRFYVVNVAFRILAEVGFLVGQWYLYGFKVEAQFPCNRFPCPYTVDCFTSRPAEKTVFLCFYFIVGVIAAISSCAELLYGSMKWFCSNHPAHDRESYCVCENQQNSKHCEARAVEKPHGKAMTASLPNSVRLKAGSLRSSASRKVSSIGHKPRGKYVSTKTLMV
ncbi:gap junction delta-3 protein-like [Labrus mixtus]|uniref:gap junction delta-3 protein-like n=1 Tax=Labrus mixtus TaxID=508554 RepID=UPI0029C0B43A|nr:gap junction delta-3 protein-like [Labrus mixtus]XP_060884590.1 gap junction delta-3 protein-like [Labrus mixtus]